MKSRWSTLRPPIPVPVPPDASIRFAAPALDAVEPLRKIRRLRVDKLKCTGRVSHGVGYRRPCDRRQKVRRRVEFVRCTRRARGSELKSAATLRRDGAE